MVDGILILSQGLGGVSYFAVKECRQRGKRGDSWNGGGVNLNKNKYSKKNKVKLVK